MYFNLLLPYLPLLSLIVSLPHARLAPALAPHTSSLIRTQCAASPHSFNLPSSSSSQARFSQDYPHGDRDDGAHYLLNARPCRGAQHPLLAPRGTHPCAPPTTLHALLILSWCGCLAAGQALCTRHLVSLRRIRPCPSPPGAGGVTGVGEGAEYTFFEGVRVVRLGPGPDPRSP